MNRRAPFRNVDDSAAYLAKSALVAVITGELLVHGFDSLPKFRRAREIARARQHMRRAMRREALHIRARLPLGVFPDAT